MIFPCIDLMGGQAVQLVKGKTLALSETVDDAMRRFAGFPSLHVIDLDAAMNQGANTEAIARIAGQFRVRVGGGIRSVEDAERLLALGADQLIIGSRAYKSEQLDLAFLEECAAKIGPERLILAVDCLGGQVAIDAWRRTLPVRPEQLAPQVADVCAGVLCTFVDREGMLQGTDVALFARVRQATRGTVTAAGGITTLDEVDALLNQMVEVALGMAVYTDRLPLSALKSRLQS